MMRVALLSLVAVVLAGLTQSAVRAEDEAKGPAKVGDAAPAFTLEDQTGKKVSLSDFKGKIVVLEWFNEQCPVCARHIKAKTMVTIASNYAAKDVVFLGVNSTAVATNESNAKAATAHQLNYPILNDSTGAVGHAYGAKTTPHMFIIDKDGKLVYAGGIDNDPRGNNEKRVNYVTQALDELLAGKEVSVKESQSYGCSVKYAK